MGSFLLANQFSFTDPLQSPLHQLSFISHAGLWAPHPPQSFPFLIDRFYYILLIFICKASGVTFLPDHPPYTLKFPDQPAAMGDSSASYIHMVPNYSPIFYFSLFSFFSHFTLGFLSFLLFYMLVAG